MEQSWTELHHRTCDFVAFSVVKAVENAGLENEKLNSSTGKKQCSGAIFSSCAVWFVIFSAAFSIVPS